MDGGWQAGKQAFRVAHSYSKRLVICAHPLSVLSSPLPPADPPPTPRRLRRWRFNSTGLLLLLHHHQRGRIYPGANHQHHRRHRCVLSSTRQPTGEPGPAPPQFSIPPVRTHWHTAARCLHSTLLLVVTQTRRTLVVREDGRQAGPSPRSYRGSQFLSRSANGTFEDSNLRLAHVFVPASRPYSSHRFFVSALPTPTSHMLVFHISHLSSMPAGFLTLPVPCCRASSLLFSPDNLETCQKYNNDMNCSDAVYFQ